MKKKFKNSINLHGSATLLHAFELELKKLGYIKSGPKGESILIPHPKGSPWMIGINGLYLSSNPSYDFFTGAEERDYSLTLPQDWNRALELAAEVEEEKVDLKSGDYVKIKTDNIRKIYRIDPTCHSIGSENGLCIYSNDNISRKATPQEIKEHLIAKAKELGFKEGVTIEITGPNECTGFFSEKVIVLYDTCVYFEDWDSLGIGGRIIYEKGVWATIVEEKKPEYKVGDLVYITAGKSRESKKFANSVRKITKIYISNPVGFAYVEGSCEFIGGIWLDEVRHATPEEIREMYQPSTPAITINGYKGEFHDEYVKFGCAKIDAELFVDLIEADEMLAIFYSDKDGQGTGNKSITGIQIGEGLFTIDQIKEIAEYYNNKNN